MQVTERDLRVLDLIRPHRFLPTAKIREGCFPQDKDGSIARSRLRKLWGAGLIYRRVITLTRETIQCEVFAWTLTEAGVRLLNQRVS